MDTEPVQIFIKNEKGQIWGPLTAGTIELLLENGIVQGRVMVSLDGVKYALPGRFPDLRDAFPRELWGVDVPPGETPPPSQPTPMPVAPAAAPKAGPGATASFTAGPGARAAAQGRPQAPRGSGPPVITSVGPAPVRTPTPKQAVAPPSPPTPAPATPSPPAPRKTAPAPPPPAPEGAAAPPSSGDLAEISAVKLYSLAAGAELTALLTFDLPDREIQLHLRKGNPEFVDSTHPEDSLATFLVKAGMARPEQLAQAEAQKDRFGGELLSALFGSGILNPGTAFAQLIERAKSLLARAFVATSGSFTVEPKELPPQRSMPVGQKWAVLSELVRRIPPAELKRRLQGEWDLPAMKSEGRIQSSDLRLTPQETRALSYVDGVRSLAQFQKDMPQEYETVLRVVFLLGELDGVSFAAVPTRPAPTPEAPPQAPPKPAAPAGPPKITAASGSGPKAAAGRPPPGRSPSASRPAASTPAHGSSPRTTPFAGAPAAESIEELRALAAKLKTQNHFEALEVTDKADAGQVKVAYFRLAKLYHPDTVPEGAAPELGQLKAEIFARVGDAYRTLSDEKLRASYVEELKYGGKGEQVDVSQLLLAEELFQKGCILVKARKWPEAVKMLDEAIKNNAEEPEFYAWRGYAKFFANPDRKAGNAEAQKDLVHALKKNEGLATAHYFVGHIAKVNGDEKLALREFRKAVDLNPDHIDAAREVRLMSGKK